MLLLFAGCQSPPLLRSPRAPARSCFIGDVGMGSVTQALVAKRLAAEGCGAVFVLGDLIYPRGVHAADDENFVAKFWNYYRATVEADPKPLLYLVLGNHDYRGSTEAWTELTRRYPALVMPAAHYGVELGDLCFSVYDSTPLAEGVLRSWHQFWQGQRFASLREGQSGCRHRLALIHHPYASPGPHGDAKGGLRRFFEKHVLPHHDTIISGHDHILAEVPLGRKVQYVSGAGAYTRAADRKAGFLVLDYEAGRLAFRFVKVDAPEG